MARDDQEKWDRRYADAQGPDGPSNFLAEILSAEAWSIPPGRALDVACGMGRNALFLATRGFEVTALDISIVALAEARRRALARSLAVSWQQADLEQIQLPQARYDLIVIRKILNTYLPITSYCICFAAVTFFTTAKES